MVFAFVCRFLKPVSQGKHRRESEIKRNIKNERDRDLEGNYFTTIPPETKSNVKIVEFFNASLSHIKLASKYVRDEEEVEE